MTVRTVIRPKRWTFEIVRVLRSLVPFSRGVLSMMRRTVVLAAVLSLVAVLGVYAQNGVKSGPQVGEKVPGPFHPLNITGKSAGEKHCLYCDNGPAPVAVVFARELTPEVTALIKKLDDATV